MPVYIITLDYQVPFDKIMEIVPEHRNYLDQYYEDETVLFSGVKCSNKGGMIVMRADNDNKVEELIAGDPFNQYGLANYDYVCMESRRHQSFIDEWMDGK